MKKVLECDGGCVAPSASLASVNGVGNAVPASMAAMTGAAETSNDCVGSGDKWDGLGKKKKKYIVGKKNTNAIQVMKKTESLEEAIQFQDNNPGTEMYIIEE